MKGKHRITVAFQRQMVIGVAYLCKTVWIGFLCFNIEIDCGKQRLPLINFHNRFKL